MPQVAFATETPMNIYADVAARIVSILEQLKAEGALPADISFANVEATPPRDPTHGDVASNAAMVLAKAAKKKPREIADVLAAKLKASPGIAKVEVAGPGFLNITFGPSVWQQMVPAIRRAGKEFGRPRIGKGETVDVEYVSANPTGPMHVGHTRGAVFGDALANLLDFAGFKVTREYYINDAGGQVDVLARSAYLRYREALGESIGEIPEGLYPGDYLKPVGTALVQQFGKSMLGKPEADWLVPFRQSAVAAMMVMIKADLAALNIAHDVFFSEASLRHGKVDQVAAAIAALRTHGHIFEGRLERPLGHDGDDWEDREQTLFRSTGFGDDVDRALMKSDGSYTYFASDVAYHHEKVKRGFQHLVNVLGADHVGYVKRIKAAVAALSANKVDLDVPVCQLVNLMRNGEPIKMSKRSGNFVTLREVVDEVGPDPVRFMMLYRKHDSALDFDLVKVVEQSKENPVFYVQMGHARAKSVFRNVKEIFPDLTENSPEVAEANFGLLSDAGELELIKKLCWYPHLIAASAKMHEPHRIAFYLYELASTLHGQWSRGNESPHLRFIQPTDRSLTAARLALVHVFAQVLASGLGILGVTAPDELR
jgi:arginyl-tRNA synthetase